MASVGPTTLPLSLFVLNLFQVGRWGGPRARRWPPAAWAFLGLGVLVALGQARARAGLNLVPLVQLIGLVLFAWTLLTWWRGQGRLRRVLFPAFALVFGLWSASLLWGSGDPDLLILERVAQGTAGLDGLQFVSIESMIRTYGVPSLGLDGVSWVNYHSGSMWLIVQIASALNIRTIVAHHLASAIVMVPLLFFTLVGFALDFARTLSRSTSLPDVAANPAFWMLLVFLQVGVLPFHLGIRFGLWASNPLHVHSYMLALTFAFGWISIVLRRRLLSREGNTFWTHAAWVAVIAVLSATKLTIGAIVGAVRSYLLLRGRWLAPRALVAVGAIGCVVAACVFAFGAASLKDMVAPPAAVAGHFPERGLTLRQIVGGTLLSVCFIVVRLWGVRKRGGGALRADFMARRLLDVEVVVATCIAGLAPVLLIRIAGGSDYYFWNVQAWLSQGLLLGIIAGLDPSVRGSGLKLKGTSRVVVAAFLLLACAGVARNGYWHVRYFVENNQRWRRPIGEQGLKKGLTAALLETLASVDSLPVDEKRRALMFVPRSNDTYWNLGPDCIAAPLIAPSLSGLAQLDGSYAPGCASPYRLVQPAAAAVFARDELCGRVRRAGFENVFVLGSDGRSIQLDRLACAKFQAR